MSIHGEAPQRPPCLSEQALRELIRYALEKSYYCECPHAENDHPERNISADDVLHGLDNEDWKLESTEWRNNSWRYRIKTVDVEGEELTIIVRAIPGFKRFEVVTRW